MDYFVVTSLLTGQSAPLKCQNSRQLEKLKKSWWDAHLTHHKVLAILNLQRVPMVLQHEFKRKYFEFYVSFQTVKLNVYYDFYFLGLRILRRCLSNSFLASVAHTVNRNATMISWCYEYQLNDYVFIWHVLAGPFNVFVIHIFVC